MSWESRNRERCRECKRLKEPTILRAMNDALGRAKRRLDIADMEVHAARKEVADWEARLARAKRTKRAARAKNPKRGEG